MKRRSLSLLLSVCLASLTTILSAANPMNGNMPLVAPLFLEDESHSSIITVVNEANQQVSATLTLQDLSGRVLTTKQLELAAHSQRQLLIKDLLENTSAKAGSVILRQDPSLRGMDVAAQLSMTYKRGKSETYIDEEFEMPSEGSVLRGVADAAHTSPLIAIKSLSESGTEHNVAITCVPEEGKEVVHKVKIAGQQTLLIAPCGEQDNESEMKNRDNEVASSGGALGISVASDGPGGELAAFGVTPHRVNDGDKYFTSVAFVDPMMLHSSDTVYAGVPIGSSPLLASGVYRGSLYIANFGDQPSAIHVTLANTMSNSGPPILRTLSQFSLPAHSSKTVALDGAQPNPTLQTSFLVISDAQPGEVQSKLIAEGSASLHAVELLGKDEKQDLNGGGHPWSVNGGDNSTLLLFNDSERKKSFSVKISSDGVLWEKDYNLRPFETMAISLNQLIQSQAADDKGRKIHLGTTSGEVSWFNSDPGGGFGRMLVSNPKTTLARNFSCGYWIILCGVNLSPYTEIGLTSGLLGFLGNLNGMFCTAWSPSSCYGDSYGGGGGSYDWSVTDPNTCTTVGVTTNPGAQFTGGFGPGSTTGIGTIRSGSCSFSGYGTCRNNAFFNVAYSSYIPVDHVTGAATCGEQGYSMLYMGDANRGTYRTTEGIQIIPDLQQSSGFFAGTGETRSYSFGSPANGSTLSSADEDGVRNDCYLWNDSGHADSSGFTHDESYPYGSQGQAHFAGSGANPLEPSPQIKWDMRVVIDDPNPQAPTAYVNYNHTCYPAHHIVVNGQEVYSYIPSDNSTGYILGCLTDVFAHIIGQTSAVGVPPQP